MPSALLPAADAGPVQAGLRLRVPAVRTGEAASIHEGCLQPGESVPMHTHETTDQLLYVVSGAVRVTVGQETCDASTGDFVVKPRGVPHGFTAVGTSPATLLEISLSADFEHFVAAMAGATDPADVAALQRRFGMTFHT